MEAKQTVPSYIDCELPPESYYKRLRGEDDAEQRGGWILSVWRMIQWVAISVAAYANLQTFKSAVTGSKKPVRRTLRGLKRSLRHTFRKLFGEKTCRK